MATSSPDVLETSPVVTELLVSGMSCANCVQHVTQALLGVPGVAGAEGSLHTGRARGRWQADSDGKVASLLEAVAGAGYKATPLVSDGQPKNPAFLAGWRFNVVIGV